MGTVSILLTRQAVSLSGDCLSKTLYLEASTMKISFQLVRFNWTEHASFGKTLASIAQAVEQGGFDTLWIIDHFFQMEGAGGADAPILEAYTVLSYVAALTQRIRLGTLVTGAVYRHPGALIKTVTSLDV